MANKLLSFRGGKDSGEGTQDVVARLQGEIERLKRALNELSVLNDLAIATSSALEVQQVLDTIVEKSIKALKGEQGSILLVTEEQDSPLKTLIRQADRRSRVLSYKLGMNLTGWVLKHQQPLLVEDLATDPRFPMKGPGEEGIHSLICVPIKYKGRLTGVISLSNKKGGGSFTNDDLRLLSIIAAQSGQLIENSRLQEETLEKKRMEDELRTAREIQQGLLPTDALREESLDIAGICLTTEEVGGDYYDFFPIDEHRFAIAMADVSGHGASAALVMSMVKGILHSLAHDFGSASVILTKMNQILLSIVPRGMFVTMVYMVLDTKEKTLRFSNAGHNPIYYYKPETGRSEKLEILCPALGLTRKSNYREEEHSIVPGGALLIYTDGVTEANNELGEMFEERRVSSALEECGAGASGEILEHVQKRLSEFTGNSRLNDDVAVVAVKMA